MRNLIDPEKIQKTLGIKYKKSELYVALGSKNKFSYQFSLKEGDKKENINLFYTPDLPDSINLRITTENGYSSGINFNNITKVKYIPEYKKIVFESKVGNCNSVLSVYWRGQFDLLCNFKK